MEDAKETIEQQEATDAEPTTDSAHAEEREMGFLDHLEELRWRIIYMFIGIVLGSIVVWIFKDPVMDEFLLRPAKANGMTLQNLRPFGQLYLYMQVALFGGIVISIPNILYQLWVFIAPGLYKHERRYVRWIVFFTSICFLAGVAFAYFVVLPSAFTFFVDFGTKQIENNISIDEYFNFILNLMLGAGLMFELPMLSYFLTRMSLLTPAFMRKYWRHSVVVILILASFLTPTPDPYNMLILASPLLLLYEFSIWISKLAVRQKRKKEAMNASG